MISLPLVLILFSGTQQARAQAAVAQLTTTKVTRNSATVSWTPVNAAISYSLRYKKVSAGVWNRVDHISAQSFEITALETASSYEVEVGATEANNLTQWSARLKFTTANKNPVGPNIVMILLDDARYDAFVPTTGPSFLNYPSIDRIANEGVNFKYFMPTTSRCTPSRGTILTGVYAHKNGALFNADTLDSGFPQIQQILRANGYFTGVIGKYTFSTHPPGCDWYAVSSLIVYENPYFNVNGDNKSFPTHVSDAYTHLLTDFFDSLPPNKPFFLMFWPIMPHIPTIPRPEDSLLYIGNTMPFPVNFYQYQYNYPNYYTTYDHTWQYSASQTDSLRLKEFQTQQCADMNIDSILKRLEAMGVLDSTLIIFASDNGFIKGEHLMKAKQVALEESIRLPLFIRYPKWFPAGSHVDDEIASNADLAPTILEAANITDTFNYDGVSVHQLYNGSVQRKYFYYEYYSDGATPPMRAVRSLDYKYINTFCNDTTEEFYDLIHDPHEDTNQIFNPAYAALIQQYRDRLDSFKTALDDTGTATRPCHLNNIDIPTAVSDEQEADLDVITASPVPADAVLRLGFYVRAGVDVSMEIRDAYGAVVLNEDIRGTGWKNISLSCLSWPSGIYFVNVEQANRIRSCKVMVMH